MGYKLLNGEWTDSEKTYLNEWDSICKEFEAAMPPYKVLGFDPGVAIAKVEGKRIVGESISISRAFLIDLLAKFKEPVKKSAA